MVEKLDNTVFIALTRGQELCLHAGDTITAHIISTAADGTVKLRIRNIVFTAKTSAPLQAGQHISMHVSFRENQLLLSPLLPSISESDESLAAHIARLSDPSLAEYIAASFSEMNAAFDYNEVLGLYRFIEAAFRLFPDKQKKLAEEAALIKKRLAFLALALRNKHIALNEAVLWKVYFNFYKDHSRNSNNNKNAHEKHDTAKEKTSEADHTSDKKIKERENKALSNIPSEDLVPPSFEDSSTELLKVFNHIKRENDLQWLLIPFSKEAKTGTMISGSLAFLLEIKKQRCIKTVVRAEYKGEHFVFELKDQACCVYFENKDTPFMDEPTQAKFLQVLHDEFLARNLMIACSFGKVVPKIPTIDLEA